MHGFRRVCYVRIFSFAAVLLQINPHPACAGLKLGGRAGGGSSAATVNQTVYVGNLYEETGETNTSYIYLGNIRVAAVSQGQVSYYHGDHLGGTNVITDEIGARKELAEYTPFGSTARREVYPPAAATQAHYYTGKPRDDETGLYYFGSRYYDPALGRFTTPDAVIQNPDNPQTLNRYSYTSNNPVNRVDPDGHSWWKKFTGWLSDVFEGAIRWLEKVTNSKWYVDIEVGQSYQFQDFRTFTTSTRDVGVNILSRPWDVGIGVKNWIYDPRFKIIKAMYDQYEKRTYESYVEDDDHIFVNGILNDEAAAVAGSRRVGAMKVAYNPTDGILADLTEAFLEKLTFTGSIERQLAAALADHRGIILSGHSQGGIIIGNTLLNMGLSGNRGAVSDAFFYNTQITRSRAYISSIISGVESKHVTYFSRYFDFSNALGPNLSEPDKFLSGVAGLLIIPVGIQHHGLE